MDDFHMSRQSNICGNSFPMLQTSTLGKHFIIVFGRSTKNNKEHRSRGVHKLPYVLISSRCNVHMPMIPTNGLDLESQRSPDPHLLQDIVGAQNSNIRLSIIKSRINSWLLGSTMNDNKV